MPNELKERTQEFALRVIQLVRALPAGFEAQVIGRQLLRSATSVGANYRSACRGRSRAEFLAKLGVVEEEADESVYWLELIIKSKMLPTTRIEPLLAEANELVAIFVSAKRTTKNRRT
ncbi:MAG: four helix bundle protein [Phycisphaeraceae bacterium]